MNLKSILVAGALTVCASIAHAADYEVIIKGFAYEPAVLTIAAGDTVTFVNQDNAPHTATDKAGAFDTGRLTRGGEASLTFNGAGTYDYFCALHPNMTAQIVVE